MAKRKLKCWEKEKGSLPKEDFYTKKGSKTTIWRIEKLVGVSKSGKFPADGSGADWKKFKTETKSIKFTKDYMKKHNVC